MTDRGNDSYRIQGKWSRYRFKDERYIIPTLHFEMYAKEMDQRMKLLAHKIPLRYDFYDPAPYVEPSKGVTTRLMVITSPDWKLLEYSHLKKRDACCKHYLLESNPENPLLETMPCIRGEPDDETDVLMKDFVADLKNNEPELSVKLNRTAYKTSADCSMFVTFDYDMFVTDDCSPSGSEIRILEDKYCLMSAKVTSEMPEWLADMQGRFRSHRATYTMYDMAKTMIDGYNKRTPLF